MERYVDEDGNVYREAIEYVCAGLMTSAQVAEALKVSPGTVAGWRSSGLLPSYQISPRVVLHWREDVAELVRSLAEAYAAQPVSLQELAAEHAAAVRRRHGALPLEQVAQLYRQEVEAADSEGRRPRPVVAIAAAWPGRNRSTYTRWLKECRDAGLLPQAQHGKVSR